MKPEKLSEILKAIKNVKIAIAGDFCLDAYWFINESMSEISLETGMPTYPVERQEYSPGGASNIANNLVAMGVGEVMAFGVTGNDPFGVEMARIFGKLGIKTASLLVQEKDWATHVFAKPYSGGRELNRVDFGNSNILSIETADKLISHLAECIPGIDLIIINQQVYSGINTEFFRKKLTGVISRFPDRIFIADSRAYNDSYHGAYRKMNDREALRLCGNIRKPEEEITYDEVKDAALSLFSSYGKPIFITRGSKGSVVADSDGIFEMPGIQILGKTDTVGAGDSYLAGIAATLAAGYSNREAAEIGAYVAAVTVKKLYTTGTAYPQEIMEAGRDPDFIYSPELAGDQQKACYHGKTGIEIIRKPDPSAKIRYAIFDNDGTISTLREGWEKIMGPMMEKVIIGTGDSIAVTALAESIRLSIRDFINQTTGIQTLAQMKMLIPLIREFGLVPDSQILDEHGYKKIYNEELLKMVKEREEKLAGGSVSPEDFTIRGSIDFLKYLHKKGIKLYLTSGTDIEDVRHEANVLGYSELFEGRIFGAVGDVEKEAKKIVLDKILDEIGSANTSMIVTFGDGPVEIRETHKRGGTTVGVATDEVKRHGLNSIKRTRLIKAGAGIIIPDFSEPDELLGLLNIR
jgi:rfaE bifunctional protein kinase chain/domain